MSDNFKRFELLVWYMSKDYQNLLRIEKVGTEYHVTRFFDCKVVFTGMHIDCQFYMNQHCMQHNEFLKGVRK